PPRKRSCVRTSGLSLCAHTHTHTYTHTHTHTYTHTHTHTRTPVRACTHHNMWTHIKLIASYLLSKTSGRTCVCVSVCVFLCACVCVCVPVCACCLLRECSLNEDHC